MTPVPTAPRPSSTTPPRPSRGSRSVRGRFGSPGAARSAGVAAALAGTAHGHRAPEWLVTVDADVEIDDGWLTAWTARLDGVDCGRGVRRGQRRRAPRPRLRPVSQCRPGQRHVRGGGDTGGGAVGVVNLNGVNHAVRTSAYLTAGPYVQPSAPGPHGPANLAGSDWDLGVRVRLAGYTIATCDATVRDRGRRVLADVSAYVSGDAYEGPFAACPPRRRAAGHRRSRRRRAVRRCGRAVPAALLLQGHPGGVRPARPRCGLARHHPGGDAGVDRTLAGSHLCRIAQWLRLRTSRPVQCGVRRRRRVLSCRRSTCNRPHPLRLKDAMAHLSPITCIDHHAETDLVATGGYDGRAVAWRGEAPIWTTEFDDLVNDVRFDPIRDEDRGRRGGRARLRARCV